MSTEACGQQQGTPCSWAQVFSTLAGEAVPSCTTCEDVYTRRPDGCPFKTKSDVPVTMRIREQHIGRVHRSVKLPEPMSVLSDKEIMGAVAGWKQFDRPEGANTTEAILYGAMRCVLDLYVQKAQGRMTERHDPPVNGIVDNRPGAL